MSEIRVTSVVGENGGDRVGLTTGLTVGPLTGTTGIGATITHQGHAQFAGVCTATSFVGSGANLTGVTAGLFSSYAIISDTKASNVNGGTFTSGAWRTRDLQTENADPDNIVSISSNQFTLQAGSYLIKASCPAHLANAHMCQIYNDTDSTVEENGTPEYVFEGGSTTRSFVMGRVTIASAKEFTIRHRVSRATSGNGFGVPNGWTSEQRYTMVEIYKES